MFERLVSTLRDVPATLRELPSRVATKPARLARQTRRTARHARHDGEQRLWEAGTVALERADGLLGRATDAPVVGRVARPASEFVHARLEAVLRPDVDGYDELNAKDVGHALEALDHIELLKVRRYEAAHKNRKTVLAAVDRELEKRVAALDADAAAA